jgi:hypothetical protein
LKDESSSKKPRTTIAELSRPARSLNHKFKDKTKKCTGRKRKTPIRSAKYHNWHTPFIWRQIQLAAKRVGWRMSATEIVRDLQKHDPEVFAGLRRTTVNSWIDRSGDKPCWTAALLAKVEQGNDPGHNKGGQCGILVSTCDMFKLTD